MTPVAVALGSNMGDREAHLAFALGRLRPLLTGLQCSTWHDTTAIGPGEQPRYLNGAVVGGTTLGARAFLDALLAIEVARGRERPFRDAPRTLDLDLILYGSAIIDEPGLRIPHPRFRQRRFVLGPLAEVAPDWVDPETGRTVAELLASLPAA